MGQQLNEEEMLHGSSEFGCCSIRLLSRFCSFRGYKRRRRPNLNRNHNRHLDREPVSLDEDDD